MPKIKGRQPIRNLIRLAWAALSVSAEDFNQSDLLYRRRDPEAAPTKVLSQGATAHPRR